MGSISFSFILLQSRDKPRRLFLDFGGGESRIESNFPGLYLSPYSEGVHFICKTTICFFIFLDNFNVRFKDETS